MKRSLFIWATLTLLALSSLGCGGGASSTTAAETAAPTSLLTKRAFVLNQFSGKIQIVDAATDTLSNFQVPSDVLQFFINPQFMIRAATKTLVYDSGNNFVSVLDDAKENRIAAVQLSGFTESIVLSADNNTAYAAIPSLGRIDVVDVAAGKLLDPINNIPGVRRLAISKNGSKILAFSNDVNTVYVVTASDKSVAGPIAGFDRPYTAIFSSDDSKAFVLNCGSECGGTSAKVTVVDMSTNALGSSVVVGGATVGLLDGSNLYVAGSPATSTATTNGGRVNAVNVSNTAALTTGTAVAISDGLHHTMALTTNSKLYIGALRCRNVENGCLSVYNTSSSTATIGPARGEVTSVAPIKNRSVVYVTEGGDLRIYDITTDALQTKQIITTGKVVDAKEVD